MKNKFIKAFVALLISGVILPACSNSSTPESKSIEVYKDNSVARIGSLVVKINDVYSSASYSKDDKGYKSRLVFRFENTGETSQDIVIKNSAFTCEDNQNACSFNGLKENETLEGNKSTLVITHSITPTPLDEGRYSLSALINNVNYYVHLYNKPDSERVNYTVNYLVDNKTVKTMTVKENKPIGEDYIYENPNHLTSCNIWKDNNDKPIGSGTKVNSNLTISGKEKSNISFVSKNDPTIELSASSLDYIPSDKVVVVPNEQNGLEVNELADNLFFSKQVKTIYLPKSIQKIGSNNFFRCSILEGINYEGTEEEWNAINNLSKENIPDNVKINFNTSFVN